MNDVDLLPILARGDDSRHQFKRDVTNIDSVAADLAALANSGGGQLFLVVDDDGSVAGLNSADVNALIHRDYFTSASIRIMVYSNRVEIASPGHLPDSLSVEAILRGRTNRRNPTLTEHASQILPYRGMGSGIPRALQEWSHIDLIDDVEGNQFSAVVWRPQEEWTHTEEVTPPESQPESLEARVMFLLAHESLSKSDLSARLGQRAISGQLNRVVRLLLAEKHIEMTVPEKPTSRLQKYRLTEAGRARLARLSGGPEVQGSENKRV